MAIGLTDPGRGRASRFSGLRRRVSGISGENVSVSTDESRERERISAPSSLSRLSVDTTVRRGRPWLGGGAIPYSMPIFPKLSVAARVITAAEGGCMRLGAA